MAERNSVMGVEWCRDCGVEVPDGTGVIISSLIFCSKCGAKYVGDVPEGEVFMITGRILTAEAQQEPMIITAFVPEGYQILVDEQDNRFYSQRQGEEQGTAIRFATRQDQVGGHLDHVISFVLLGNAIRLCEHDAANQRPNSWGSLVYTAEELAAIVIPEPSTQAYKTHLGMVTIHPNNAAIKSICPFCDSAFRPDFGLWAFLGGWGGRPICMECWLRGESVTPASAWSEIAEGEEIGIAWLIENDQDLYHETRSYLRKRIPRGTTAVRTAIWMMQQWGESYFEHGIKVNWVMLAQQIMTDTQEIMDYEAKNGLTEAVEAVWGRTSLMTRIKLFLHDYRMAHSTNRLIRLWDEYEWTRKSVRHPQLSWLETIKHLWNVLLWG